MKLKITNVRENCGGCPSIYDFEVVDNKKYKSGYVRYRWGGLSITLANHYDKNVYENGCSYGDSFDGVISFREVVEVLEDALGIYLEIEGDSESEDHGEFDD